MPRARTCYFIKKNKVKGKERKKYRKKINRKFKLNDMIKLLSIIY